MIAVYLALGAMAYWPVLPGISGRLFGVDGDFVQSVWFIGWVPHALAHGLDPFYSKAMYVPIGVNLAQNTASPFLGLLTAPLALVLSPQVIGNLLLLLAMPISATAAFVVLRLWGVWCPAAALGGLIYGFSPYMVGQSLGHPELTFVPLPPFIALTVASILQGRGRPRRLGILLGLLVTAQYLISPEVLAMVVVLTLIAMVYVAIGRPSAVPVLARTAAVPVAIALGVAVVLLAYPVWMLVAGPEHYAGPLQPLGNPYYNDALSFVVPGTLQRVSLGMPVSWSGTLSVFQPTEAGGYIGIPMVLVASLLAWRSRRSARMLLSVALFVTSALLSLGSHLYVHGRPLHIPLPFIVLRHLPLVNSVLPSRISLETDAFLAAVIAFGIDDLRRSPARSPSNRTPRTGWSGRTTATVVAVLTLAVLLVTQLPVWPYPTASASGLPAGVRQAIPGGDPVAVTYPYTNFPYLQPMIWQADSGFAFRMLGGYARHSNAHGSGAGFSPVPLNPPGLQQFLIRQEYLADPLLQPFTHISTSSPTPSELARVTRTTIRKYHVRLVIVDRSMRLAGPVMEVFTDALGPPTRTIGEYSLWTEP